MTVELSPAAIADANQAFNWYEDQRDGLGLEFSAELRRMVGMLAEYPELGHVVFGETRQAVLQRFPYSLFYRLLPGAVLVVAVFHASRDPKIWQIRPDA